MRSWTHASEVGTFRAGEGEGLGQGPGVRSVVEYLHQQVHQRLVLGRRRRRVAISEAVGAIRLDGAQHARVLEQQPPVPEELRVRERARDEGLELGRHLGGD